MSSLSRSVVAAVVAMGLALPAHAAPAQIDAPYLMTAAALAPFEGSLTPVVLTATELKKERSYALPIVLGGVAVAAVITAIVLGSLAQGSAKQARETKYQSDSLAYATRAQAQSGAGAGCWGVAGVAALASVLTLFIY